MDKIVKKRIVQGIYQIIVSVIIATTEVAILAKVLT